MWYSNILIYSSLLAITLRTNKQLRQLSATVKPTPLSAIIAIVHKILSFQSSSTMRPLAGLNLWPLVTSRFAFLQTICRNICPPPLPLRRHIWTELSFLNAYSGRPLATLMATRHTGAFVWTYSCDSSGERQLSILEFLYPDNQFMLPPLPPAGAVTFVRPLSNLVPYSLLFRGRKHSEAVVA